MLLEAAITKISDLVCRPAVVMLATGLFIQTLVTRWFGGVPGYILTHYSTCIIANSDQCNQPHCGNCVNRLM